MLIFAYLNFLGAKIPISNFVFFRHLNISYNLLKDLPRSGFYGLDTIETLDLSFNDLRSVDSSLFDNMNWLVDLRVSFSIMHQF